MALRSGEVAAPVIAAPTKRHLEALRAAGNGGAERGSRESAGDIYTRRM